VGVQFNYENGKLLVRDLLSVQALDRGHFGRAWEGKKIQLELLPEEALYLIDVRNAQCFSGAKELSFNKLAAKLQGPRFLARYYGYRDWRDRGLVPRSIEEAKEDYGRSPVLKYPSAHCEPPEVKAKGLLFYDDLFSLIDDDEVGQAIYESHWFGQFGTYKAKKHGRFNKLDAYETLFLMRHAGYKLNVSEKRLLKEATKRRSDFLSLYEVYEDWRMRGYVLKTGFKFGTHFRLYFPGAKPTLETGEWVHSKHVIHVFPRDATMLISEWARAIRVAHGVRKTFILAIPGAKKQVPADVDFLLYHRKGGNIEVPPRDPPRYVMLALSEEEELGGQQLARAIERAQELGLDLILAIVDRETSVTYYEVKRIELPGSKYEYYEIEWVQP